MPGDGRRNEIAFRYRPMDPEETVVPANKPLLLSAVDDRTRASRDLTAAARGPLGPGPIIAPMPGLVVRTMVAAGDRVAAGQGLVVMEAMKMENELRAAGAGTVRRVNVSPGMPVEKGAVLIELE